MTAKRFPFNATRDAAFPARSHDSPPAAGILKTPGAAVTVRVPVPAPVTETRRYVGELSPVAAKISTRTQSFVGSPGSTAAVKFARPKRSAVRDGNAVALN